MQWYGKVWAKSVEMTTDFLFSWSTRRGMGHKYIYRLWNLRSRRSIICVLIRRYRLSTASSSLSQTYHNVHIFSLFIKCQLSSKHCTALYWWLIFFSNNGSFNILWVTDNVCRYSCVYTQSSLLTPFHLVRFNHRKRQHSACSMLFSEFVKFSSR